MNNNKETSMSLNILASKIFRNVICIFLCFLSIIPFWMMIANATRTSVDIQARHMGIDSKIIPMSNEDSEIKILTDIGELEFHEFLIKHQCEPEVKDIVFSKVTPAGSVIDTIKNSDAVIIGPSNPVTSIMPILSLKGVKEALKSTHVVAVSPIIGNDSVSGPASKFMKALGIEVSSLGVAELYKDFLDVMVIDEKDENLKDSIGEIINKVIITNTIMNSSDVKINLTKKILEGIYI